MKSSEIPFNMKIHYDEQLNEQAINFEEMEKGVDFLKEKYESLPDKGAKGVVLLGQIGSYLRVLNQLPEAEKTFEKAQKIIKEHDLPHIAMAIDLRMALIHLAKKKYVPANKIFEDALKTIKESDDKKLTQLSDFALFHYARSKFAEGCLQEARDMVTRALELRLVKGDLEVIEHTQNVLGTINQKIGEN